MALTPVELRHTRFPRRPLGYAREAVDRLLADAVDSFEEVWRERADLADRVEHLEGELVRFRELEGLLRTTLVSAERAAHELKAQAKREADVILAEARAEARAVAGTARSEHERLLVEARRVRSLLRSALETVQEVPAAEAADRREAA